MCVRLCMRTYVIISITAINPQHPPEPCGVAGSGAMYLSDKLKRSVFTARVRGDSPARSCLQFAPPVDGKGC